MFMAFVQFLKQHRVRCLQILVIILVIALILMLHGRVQKDDSQASSGPESPVSAVKKDFSKKESPPVLYAFPKGGRQLLPDYRFVALYGAPGIPAMGILGEQTTAANIQKIKDLASEYQKYSKEPVWPTFEVITTIASSSPTSNGDYSREIEPAQLQPLIQAAKEAGIYCILDLQPGRTDFLTQARQYEALLKEPHVGLALDPEWRLKPDQLHLKQIGSVAIAEVNSVSRWLADLAKQHALPQKMFLLHQFRLSMITGRQQLDTSRNELAYIIQMDGNGAQSTKLSTWNSIRANAPAAVYFGWKNFYDEDKPMLSPDATMLLTPQPWFVSYQ